MIRSTDLIAKFRTALNQKWGYIWGTSGIKWTEARQKEIEKTTDPDRAQARKIGSKWIGHTVADCSGLFTWAFRQLGGEMYHGSDTMYRKWCEHHGEMKNGKRTDSAALKPGTAVFCWNGEKYSHVGLFVGDGTVIEAMNTEKGVVTSKVTATKWKYWGELKGVSFGDEPQPSGHPVLRYGDKGEAVRELQRDLQKLGYGLGPCGVDGDFGSATKAAVEKFQLEHGIGVDGICGAKTWPAIEKALKEKPGVKYSAVIPHLTEEEADKIVKQYAGAYKEKEGG